MVRIAPGLRSETVISHCGICKAILAAFACALHGPSAGAEFQVCAAGSDQSRPAAASSADRVLVVWQDSRNSAVTGIDIRAAFLDAGGVVSPPGEFVVCGAAGDQSFPRVATDGTSFLVVWQDARAGNKDIYAALVTASGEVSPAGGLAVDKSASAQQYPDVAWAGSCYVVAWEHDESGNWDIHAARVSAAGELLDSTPIVVDAASDKEDSVAVAGADGRALVVYRDSAGGTHIKGAVVGADGTVSPTSPSAIANAASTQKSPHAALGGGVWLVAWEDWRDGNADIYAARVDPLTGKVLDGAPHLALCKDAYKSTSPAVAFDGGNFVVVWEDDRNSITGGGSDIYAARLTPSGAVREGLEAVYSGPSDQKEPALARWGPGVAAVWTDGRGSSPGDIFGTFLTTNDPPVASAAASNPSPSEGDRVTLDGSASTDPEGVALVFEWTQLEGPACALDDPASAAPSFQAPQAASGYTLRFSLRVSDGLNWSAPAELVLDVQADDDPPVAVATAAPESATEGDLVTLDGTRSSDPEGAALSYSWTQLSGPRATLSNGREAVCTFQAPNELVDYTLVFALVVSDGARDSAAAEVEVRVGAGDDPPVARAGEDYSIPPLAPAGLDGSGSFDPEGKPLSYRWTQLAGPPVALSGALGPFASFTAPDAEAEITLVFRLEVSDGASSSADEIEVRVVPSEAGEVPVASGIQVSASSTQAAVTWSTEPVAAVGLVRYGTTRALGSESPEELNFETSHSVLLDDLRSGATYWFVVRSRNAAGAWSLSEPRSFRTLPPSSADDPDGDGIPDSWETSSGFESPSACGPSDDPDGDGLSNIDEYRHGTDPHAWDTDGDGFADGYEVLRDSNPTRSDSVPEPFAPRADQGCGEPGSGPALGWVFAALAAAVVRVRRGGGGPP